MPGPSSRTSRIEPPFGPVPHDLDVSARRRVLTALSTSFSTMRRSRSASVTTSARQVRACDEISFRRLAPRTKRRHPRDLHRRHLFPLRRALARLEPRQLEQVLDEIRHPAACVRILPRKRSAVGGSAMAPSSSASTKPRIDVRGVRNSWEALATKSRGSVPVVGVR